MGDPVQTVAAVLTGATAQLAEGSDTPRLDAEVLLSHVLGVDRTGLILRFSTPIAPEEREAFSGLLDKRRAGQPVAYLTGHREFMGLDFAVGPGVLIPRPETELLVERALSWLETRVRISPSSAKPASAGVSGEARGLLPRAASTRRRGEVIRILDVGCGSGAIAVALASLADPALSISIVATDPSVAALAYARRNAAAHDPLRRVLLVRADLAEPLTGPFDLVLANLPYLTPAQIAGSPSIAFEPRQALLGGSDGLDLIRRLIADLSRLIAPNGTAGFEIDPDQTEAAELAVAATLPAAHTEVIHDLAGLARHIWIELPG